MYIAISAITIALMNMNTLLIIVIPQYLASEVDINKPVSQSTAMDNKEQREINPDAPMSI